jgi:hypothetical protein
VYELSVKWHTGTWHTKKPVPADQVAHRVNDAMAMLGRQVPAAVLDPEFPALLAEAGKYEQTVDGVVEIRVWREAVNGD